MSETLTFLYDVPKDADAILIEKSANVILQQSHREMRAILKKYKAPVTAAEALCAQHIPIKNKGAGLTPDTAAIAVMLTPLVHVLVPLLKPIPVAAAKVAQKVALDTWEMLKSKLWGEKHIRLEERIGDTKQRGKGKNGRKAKSRR